MLFWPFSRKIDVTTTLEELKADLEHIKATIDSIRDGGQANSGSKISMTKVDYATLLREKRALETRIAVLEAGSPFGTIPVVFGQ